MWTAVDVGLAILPAVWGSSATHVLALGFGNIRRYNGSVWLAEDVSEQLLLKADGSGPGNVFAVGENGEIDHFDGLGWSRQANPLTPTTPTLRIGEYNGVASSGGGSYSVWCGNTFNGASARDQQSVFDRFQTNWQTGVSLVDLTYRTSRLVLESPRPNPTKRSVTVAYALPRSATVDLSLVDVQGRRVATLIHGMQPAGRHVVSYDELASIDLATGLYLLRLDDGRERTTRKLTVLE
jgi:hypothetical protein